MINVILYEDDEKIMDKYIDIINKYTINNNIEFKTYKYNHFKESIYDDINSIDGKKLFIVDVEVPLKSGLEFAREIRLNGDWQSPIIVCSSHEEFKNTGFTSRILMLDFISKNHDIEKNLNESLDVAFDILKCNTSFSFKYNGEYYNIPYDSILYIEKNLNDNYSTIYTKNNTYIIKDTINNIIKNLNDSFFQSHRSCIINLDKVISIDFSNNIIYFENKSTPLLSREAKKQLKNIINM